jgi:hypothetical protein
MKGTTEKTETNVIEERKWDSFKAVGKALELTKV